MINDIIIFPPDLLMNKNKIFHVEIIMLKLIHYFKVLRLRGLIPRDTKWDVVVDLFFYREPEEAEKEEQAAKESVTAIVKQPEISAPLDAPESDWNPTEPTDWASESVPPVAPVPGATSYVAPTEDWAAEVAQEQWNNSTAAPAPASANWGGSADWH